MAKPTESPTSGITDKVPQPTTIKVMQAEIVTNTKHDVEGELMCIEALFPHYAEAYSTLTIESNPLLALKAVADPDTMYLHQAMQEPDWK